MSRFFTWAAVPMLLICLFFDTAYIDLCLLTVLIIPLVRIITKKPVTASGVAVIFSIIAFCLCQNTHAITSKSFYPLIGKPITLECVINGAPSHSGNRVTYPVRMLSANHKGEVRPLEDNAIVYCDCDCEDDMAKYGDRLEFKTILTLPRDGGLTSRRRYLLGQGISVVCSTEDFAVTNHGTSDGVSPITLGIYRLRDYLKKKCDRFFSTDTSAFVKAILLGENTNIPADIKEDITRSGISHIVSVSGLHLSLIVIISSAFLGAMGIKKSKYDDKIMAILGIICGVVASIITGLSPSVKRAVLMLIAANSAILIGRDKDSASSLSFALLVLLMANPFAIYDIRLLLSATAVLGIVLLSSRINRALCRFMKDGYISNLIAITLSAQIFSTPVTVMYFGTFSLVSLFTNIIAVPLMFPLMLLGLIFLISPFGIISGFISGGMWLIIQIVLKVSEMASSLPFAQIEIDFGTYLRTLVFAVAAIGGIWQISVAKGTLSRFTAFGVAGAIMFTSLASPLRESLTMDFIDSNIGECSLIQIGNNINILVDCGDFYDSEYSASAIEKYLKNHNADKIDYLIISAITEESVYNFISLADRVKTDSVIVPDYLSADNYISRDLLLKTAERKNIEVYEMGKGDTFNLCKNACITIYSPDSKVSNCKGNMVFGLSYNSKDILFLGNADSYDNKLLLESIGSSDFDIVKISGKSKNLHTDEELLDAISPEKVFAFEKSFNAEKYHRIKEFLYNKNIEFYSIGSAPPRLTVRGSEAEIKEGEEFEEHKRAD